MRHFATTIFPCVVVYELENEKFYISITRHVNEQIAKFRSGQAPHWIRKYPLKKVIELEIDGNDHCLRQKVIFYIHNYGFENVRSTMHTSVNCDEPPKFYTYFCEAYKLPIHSKRLRSEDAKEAELEFGTIHAKKCKKMNTA